MSTVGDSVDITSFSLGNPPQSRMLKKRREREEDDLVMDYFSLDDCRLVPGTEDVEAMGGSTTLYQTDDTRYETGFTVTVYYSWNECDASCVENLVLQTESHLDLKTFRNEILNRIDNLLPVTFVQVKTVNGTLEVSVLPRNLPKENAYIHIPDTLATVSRVSISLLRKCPVMTSHFHIDIVTIAGDPSGSRYVFKRYGIDRFGPPSLVWRDGQGSTPQWYRDLADHCIAWDVDKRPSARDILDVLEAKRAQHF